MMNTTDRERLLQWMQDKGFDLETLAQVTGDTYSALYLMLRAEGKNARPIGDKFKWRFAQQFGLMEAAKVFEDTPPITVDKALA